MAPAGPVNRQEFEAGVLALREVGLVPIFSEGIFDRELYFAGGVSRPPATRKLRAVMITRAGEPDG